MVKLTNSLSSKTYVFEDKMTRLVISFSVCVREGGISTIQPFSDGKFYCKKNQPFFLARWDGGGEGGNANRGVATSRAMHTYV